MAKAAPPKKDTTAADAFGVGQIANPTEALDQFRTFAEESLSKSKEALEKAKAAFDDVQKEAEAGLHSAQEHSAKISLAAIDSMRTNTESTFTHLEKLVGVKSVAELIELQTAFMREQTERPSIPPRPCRAFTRRLARTCPRLPRPPPKRPWARSRTSKARQAPRNIIRNDQGRVRPAFLHADRNPCQSSPCGLCGAARKDRLRT